MDTVKPLNHTRDVFNLYEVEYGIDREKYQLLIYAHAYLITPYPGTLVVACDSLYGNGLFHAWSMFDIIGRRLRNIATHRFITHDERANIKDEADEIYQALTACIKMHKKNLMLSLLRINELGEVARFGGYALGQILHIFFLSYYGQKLIDAGEELSDSL
ncbi:uncharacterized protein LOC106693538 [Microplitis demolitor]|uniref:uncharacterized protein LOC106693538 n=1 Tax=Microplitis demolitor TaxID=69319 RepID=UPI0006D509E4|nr:uncharacterized protein LOC106693538 [Microplitis demolitor]